MTDNNKYKKVVENFRHHYFMKYDVKLDNELIYLFIRINEMHLDLKKDIKTIEKVEFKTSWDYFLYGVGKSLFHCLVLLLAILLILIFKK